jgi:hypothetical protein
MFGAVEQRPKKVAPEGFAQGIDPAKREHLETMFVAFTEFVADTPLNKGEQVPVTDLGSWSVQSLANTGNSILDTMREDGNDPGFYLVATDQVEDGKTEGGKPKMVPTKLVIRVGTPYKRRPRNVTVEQWEAMKNGSTA